MSVNLGLSLVVGELDSPELAEAVATAIRTIAEEEGLADELVPASSRNGVQYMVTASTRYPLAVSASRRWCPDLERRARARVKAVAPDATLLISWSYPDEE